MLDKKYNPKEVEKGKYEHWKERGYFTSGDLSKKPYCIVIPPPNVTGKLHLGHAWDTTLQDILIRYKRMDGYDALWLPGMDHAGIATQAKVDAKLKGMGIKPREMDREEWLNHAWEWKEEYAENIHNQWAKMGLSLDYTKERFTLDDGLSKAVRHVFVTLYKKGLIYRGERIINWDPEAMTALSNEEVIYKDVEGAFYHIKYMLEDSDEYLEVATTRPETLFGDTAVAVNPEDERYKHLIGKNVILPIVNKPIPIVGDEHADMEFGTGVVKITPAHDPNDFEVGNRHQLERIIVMNPDATMNENAGKYEGMDRYECREALIKDLKDSGLLVKIEPMVHSVGHSERTDVMVEPYLSKQWFVRMRPLADRVLENQKNEETKVNFVPERFEKIMNHWMEITYDWCISRQLWWGHRIPAWYKGDEVYVGMEAPEGEGWVQDSDVLDTWFSSALWPFSTLGWPEETDDFKRYYPNNVLVTGYDIIPFWVNRMTFQGLEFTDQRPFKDCLIHGLIRDKEGRKMSKSLGNGVDPMDVIEKYGADSLRYFLATSSAPGMDLRYDEEKVASTWNFINKLWNASRFVLMNLEGFTKENYTVETLNMSDQWILSKLESTIATVRKHMDQYDFHVVGAELYRFIWNDFCDWYIELAKINMNDTTKSVLVWVLTDILKMLHPFMPYVTEEIYQMLPIHDETIMTSSYPVYDATYAFDTELDDVIELIQKIRKAKVEYKIGKEYQLVLNGAKKYQDILTKMLKLDVSQCLDKMEDETLTCLSLPYQNDTVSLYYDGSANKEEERLKLEENKASLEQSITRREKLLANENYVSKAPSHIVEQERTNLEKEKAELQLIVEKLKEA
ncbi:MAG TPA: valine--tRNA ligase [Candidatus Fimihabitans intestinipullorum]|uniref:Valine--tRNA ligase n=1 Tax=Candidatus Fimihabitans intestinipullorum TaxID=2840820 RepID=A0A9D1L382_9BACT|nr:valine--tRNA ligase [Candidatus Fimihabitans intestinipullorum]